MAEGERIREILRLYAKALSGREITLLYGLQTTQRGPEWAPDPKTNRAGVTLLLPPPETRHEGEREAFAWLKVLVTHQVGHLEFGTADFSFGREARLFPNRRGGLLREQGTGREDLCDLERFLALFPERALAISIFTAVEDNRVDYLIRRSYAGISTLYETVIGVTLRRRPPLYELPAREAMVEALIRLSLDVTILYQVPVQLLFPLKAVLSLARRVRCDGATVEDSAEASLRIYEIVMKLPNVVSPSAACHDFQCHHDDGEASEQLGDELCDVPPQDQEGLPFCPPAQADYRQEVNVDLARMFERPAELPPEEMPGPAAMDDERSGPLRPDGASSFLYAEWDFRAKAYRPRWCRVREYTMEEGLSDFYFMTLREHRLLVNQLRNRFEYIVPELYRRVKRLPDGVDMDLDALVEAMVDTRVGKSSSEKIYWRWGKMQRDVAVAFLLDASATTDEFVETKRPGRNGGSVSPYGTALPGLHSSATQGVAPLRTRAIDVEKEATVLLAEALEGIGDTYGLYTFSGIGRGNVAFYVVKDLQEAFSRRVMRRIDKISPLHATRMGAAIRHTITKLEKVEQKTRILFIISDGRPQDRDYGRWAEDREYASLDTLMALQEAKRKNIKPFCLVIDKEGKDYLGEVCRDIPYEVVANINDLPTRLLLAYPRATA